MGARPLDGADVRPDQRAERASTTARSRSAPTAAAASSSRARAMQISGPEHLADALRPFTCVGVPVHHPITRRLEGVITLSCRATSGNPLLTPLMTSTAQEVESRLLAQATTSERQLLDAYLVADRLPSGAGRRRRSGHLHRRAQGHRAARGRRPRAAVGVRPRGRARVSRASAARLRAGDRGPVPDHAVPRRSSATAQSSAPWSSSRSPRPEREVEPRRTDARSRRPT